MHSTCQKKSSAWGLASASHLTIAAVPTRLQPLHHLGDLLLRNHEFSCCARRVLSPPSFRFLSQPWGGEWLWLWQHACTVCTLGMNFTLEVLNLVRIVYMIVCILIDV